MQNRNKHIKVFANKNSFLETGCYSDIGDREKQEDAYCVSFINGILLATVCDGMGGYHGGEYASIAAADCLHRKFESSPETEASFFLKSLNDMDTEVSSLKNSDNKPLHGGTTIVSAIISENTISWFSVGDSRLYILRDNEMIQVTRDHNYGESIANQTDCNSKSGTDKKNIRMDALTSYVGIGGIKLYDISEKPFCLKNNDIIVLMSDGLYKSMDVSRIISFQNADVSEMIDFIEKTIETEIRKKRDNTTFIIIKYRESMEENI